MDKREILAAIERFQGVQRRNRPDSAEWQAASAALAPLFAEMAKLTNAELHAESVAAYKANDVVRALAAHGERMRRVVAASRVVLAKREARVSS